MANISLIPLSTNEGIELQLQLWILRLGHQKATRNVHRRDGHGSLEVSSQPHGCHDMGDLKGAQSWISLFQITGELGQDLKRREFGEKSALEITV